MCTVISGDCGCGRGSSSSGVTAEGFLATGAILAAVTIGGMVFRAAWVLIGVALLAGWICVMPRARRVTFVVCTLFAAGAVGLVRLAFKRRKKPGRTVALPQEYTATMYVTGPDGRRAVLGTAPVPGTWTSAADVEREVIDRWIATHGRHPAGELGCHARPVAIRP